MKVISRAWLAPKWRILRPCGDEISSAWELVYRSAVNLTMPMAVAVEGLSRSERLLPRFLQVVDQDGDEGSVKAIRFRRGAHHGSDLPEVL